MILDHFIPIITNIYFFFYCTYVYAKSYAIFTILNRSILIVHDRSVVIPLYIASIIRYTLLLGKGYKGNSTEWIKIVAGKRKRENNKTKFARINAENHYE